MLSGPVGFAETNSTWTRWPWRGSPRPNSAGPRGGPEEGLPARLRQPHVHEAGARDLGACDEPARAISSSTSRRGDLAGRAAEAFAEHQRGVAGEVAVFGLARQLEGYRGEPGRVGPGFPDECPERLLDGLR